MTKDPIDLSVRVVPEASKCVSAIGMPAAENLSQISKAVSFRLIQSTTERRSSFRQMSRMRRMVSLSTFVVDNERAVIFFPMHFNASIRNAFLSFVNDKSRLERLRQRWVSNGFSVEMEKQLASDKLTIVSLEYERRDASVLLSTFF